LDLRHFFRFEHGEALSSIPASIELIDPTRTLAAVRMTDQVFAR
jgi:hypothetical protein